VRTYLWRRQGFAPPRAKLSRAEPAARAAALVGPNSVISIRPNLCFLGKVAPEPRAKLLELQPELPPS